MSRTHAHRLPLLVMILLLLTGCGRTPPLQRYEFSQPHMGTVFRIVLYSGDEPTGQAAADAAFARIAALNAALSDYEKESELSRLSATSGSGQPMAVGDDLWKMLVISQHVSRHTDGAFDITVGPVVQLWRRARRNGRMPEAEAVAAARRAVGYRHIALDTRRQRAMLKEPGMRLDMGGIAKGFAAEEALNTLRSHGVPIALIDAGGDLVLGDAPPDKPGWVVEIQPMVRGPASEATNEPPRRIHLANAAVATSGDAYQYVEIEGKRYSHIVDPATGLGLTTPMGVTVIVPNRNGGGKLADAYATALSVRGPDPGFRWIEDLGDSAAIVVRLESDNQVHVYESPGVERLRFIEESEDEQDNANPSEIAAPAELKPPME